MMRAGQSTACRGGQPGACVTRGTSRTECAMRMRAEWIEGGTNACAEERATLCRLRIRVADENACDLHDSGGVGSCDHVTVPAVHLAEGIAGDWWSLFGGRDRTHALVRYRSGFVVPDVRLEFDGATFDVVAEDRRYGNPKRRFRGTGAEVVSRDAMESVLSGFVEGVIDRLTAAGVEGSEVALRWARVAESRADPEVQAFCEAAGALGADPYAIDEADAALIERQLENHAVARVDRGRRDLSQW